jgi:ribonuclease E
VEEPPHQDDSQRGEGQAQPAAIVVDRVEGPAQPPNVLAENPTAQVEAHPETHLEAHAEPATEAAAHSATEPATDPAEAPQPEVVAVETLGGDDAGEERETRERRRRHPIRQYKIQEVIKRRQILLVQVVKEERGNKGRRSPPTCRWPAATAC